MEGQEDEKGRASDLEKDVLLSHISRQEWQSVKKKKRRYACIYTLAKCKLLFNFITIMYKHFNNYIILLNNLEMFKKNCIILFIIH